MDCGSVFITIILLTGNFVIAVQYQWNPEKWLEENDHDITEVRNKKPELKVCQSEVEKLKKKIKELEEVIATHDSKISYNSEVRAERLISKPQLLRSNAKYVGTDCEKTGFELVEKYHFSQLEKNIKQQLKTLKKLKAIEKDWPDYCGKKYRANERNRKIIEKYRKEQILTNNEQVMWSACWNNETELITPLLELGLSVDTVLPDNVKSTCLHIAAQQNFVKLATMLIECGANIEAKNLETLTPAMIATIWAKLDVLQLLVDKGADLSVKDQNFNLTALGWAREYNFTKGIDYLLSIEALE